MVSDDFVSRHSPISWEEPICFDGIHTYQLIIKSRALDYLAVKQSCLRNCKVIRLRLDGTTEFIRDSKRYPIPSIGFSYSKNSIHHISFNGTIHNGNGIDLLQVVNELKFLHPSTLYVLELDILTDSGMILKFAGKQMKMNVVTERIHKQKGTHETPLVLRHIYDVETLRKVRKQHIGRKLSFILVGEKGTKKTMLYKVLEDENGKTPARAINIFINDKINTKVISNTIFPKIVKMFEYDGYDIVVDSNLKMIMINSTNKKRVNREHRLVEKKKQETEKEVEPVEELK